MTSDIVPIYAKHFTHKEIKDLIDFYEIHTGKKSIKVMPVMVNEFIQVGVAWGQKLEPKFIQRLEVRFKKEGFTK